MLKGTGKHSPEPCHVLNPWMTGNKKKQLAGITHIQREINVKKDMEVEDLKNETFETVGSLGASGYEHNLETAGEKNLNSSLNVSNMIKIEGGFSKQNPVATFL